MLKVVSGIVVGLVLLSAPVLAKPTGTHSGGICKITDSAGMSGAVACGPGSNQAHCTADGACAFKISKENWNVPKQKTN